MKNLSFLVSLPCILHGCSTDAIEPEEDGLLAIRQCNNDDSDDLSKFLVNRNS